MDILAVTAAKEAGLMRLRTLLVGSAGMALVAAGGAYSLTLRSSMPAISPPEACRLIARQWNGGGFRRPSATARSAPLSTFFSTPSYPGIQGAGSGIPIDVARITACLI